MPTHLAERLSSCTGLGSILDCVLDTGLELTGASLGNIQLMDWPAGYLTIEAQHGFQREFLDFFRRVKADSGSACGRALREQRAVVIKDVMLDEDFVPYRAVAERASRRPTECEMDALRSLAALAANAIIRQRARLRVKDLDATERCIHRASVAIRHSRALLDRVEARSGGRSSDDWRW
jgi:GAF domain-containing protein